MYKSILGGLLTVSAYHDRDDRNTRLTIYGPGDDAESYLNVEASTRGFNLGVSLRIDPDRDDPVSLRLGLGPAQVFIGSDHKIMHALAAKLAPHLSKDFYKRPHGEFGVMLFGMEDDLYLEVDWFHTGDGTRDHLVWTGIKKWLGGGYPTRVSEEKDAPQLRTIRFPEGDYTIAITRVRSTWRRPRSPFTMRTTCYDWEVVVGADGRTGLPVPGKGENSYDCEEDAIFSGGMRADNIDDAAGRVYGKVMHDRHRRAGKLWRPEPPRGPTGGEPPPEAAPANAALPELASNESPDESGSPTAASAAA